MEKLEQRTETYQIIGICKEVHRQLGFGFSEIVYKDAIEIEAVCKSIPFSREKAYFVKYKNQYLKHKYIADFVMFENIIIEVKASREGIAEEHVAQTLNYMKASGCKVGLIINFGKKSLEYKRLIF